jgi:hypothetical protein
MSDSPSPLTIRVKDTKGGTQSLQVASDATIGYLRRAISECFQLTENFDIVWGYPPSICFLPDDTPLGGNMKSNDSIRIQLMVNRGQQAEGIASTKKKPAGKKIKADRPTSSSSSGSTPTNNKNKVAFGARVMTLAGPSNINNSSSAASRKRPAPRSTFSGSRQKKSARGSKEKSSGNGMDDICSALMSASEGGASGRDKALRAVYRKAVAYQYNASIAVARLGAAFAGRYTFNEASDSRVLGSGVSTKMTVTFPKSTGTRHGSSHIETVDLLTVEVMRVALLSALEDTDDGVGGGREILKPANLAKASPRIFWSLIKEFGPDISHAMSQLFPQVADWSWLSDRKKGLR